MRKGFPHSSDTHPPRPNAGQGEERRGEERVSSEVSACSCMLSAVACHDAQTRFLSSDTHNTDPLPLCLVPSFLAPPRPSNVCSCRSRRVPLSPSSSQCLVLCLGGERSAI